VVVSTVQLSVAEGRGTSEAGVEARKAVAGGTGAAPRGESPAGVQMLGGPVARSSLAWAASSWGSEWAAPARSGAENHWPRTVSKIFSASMAAVW